MSKDIITINPSKQEDPEVSSVLYDIEGNPSDELTPENAAAMKITNGVQEIYKVKCTRGGKLFNPLNTTTTYGLDAIERVNGKKMFQFREVGKNCFDNYISFLSHRYDSWLRIAERSF